MFDVKPFQAMLDIVAALQPDEVAILLTPGKCHEVYLYSSLPPANLIAA
jgi:hypothetical protein